MTGNGHRRDHTELVRTIRSVWEGELGVPTAPDDDFFTAGGSSLAAARIVGALRERAASTPPPTC